MTTLRTKVGTLAGMVRDRVKTDSWADREYAMPAPQKVKWAVLQRLGGQTDTWVETGTYLGDTTAVLAATAKHVYSIEPGPDLVRRAMQRFASRENVTILEGLSEERLPELLPELQGPVSFWLDGHYSAGITHRGPVDTPIKQELALIEQHTSHLGPVTVLIDDIRMFDPTVPEFAAYPSRGWLAQWAERQNMTWTIEHDIFAAWSMTRSPA